jgi:hypothetical protein
VSSAYLPADLFLVYCDEGLLTYWLCSYHYLNHYALFGGGYRGSAMSILRKLIAKYGR